MVALTQKASVKALRVFVITWESKFTLRNGNAIKDLLIAPKDKHSITSKGGVIYRYKYDHLGYTVEYICKTSRTFGFRCKEHLRVPSPIYDHVNTIGHSIQLNSFCIVDRESQYITRIIKEAMFIRVNDPLLNRNLGKYQLPIFGRRCCGTCWLSIYSDTPFHISFCVPLGTPSARGHMPITLVTVVLLGVPSCPFPTSILVPNFLP